MRAFTIKKSDLDRCPRHSFLPSHYNENGSCKCDGRKRRYYISQAIDVNTPDGNIMTLMGIGANWLKQLDHKEEIAEFREEMTADDYDHAIVTFRAWFGENTIKGYDDKEE